MPNKQKRKNNGYAIAELPAGIMLLLLGMAVPMMILGSVFYRVYMFDGIVKGSCQVGAVQQSYSDAEAATKAFINGHQTVGMVVNATPTISVVKKNVSYEDTSATKQYATYFYQVEATGSVDPLLHQTFFGVSIPGLTTAMPLKMVHAVYFENQKAAESASSAS